MNYTFMQDPHDGERDSWWRSLGWRKRRTRRRRMSLTQYLEFQEDQDMTRLLYFTRTQERRREEFFLSVFE